MGKFQSTLNDLDYKIKNESVHLKNTQIHNIFKAIPFIV